MASYNSVTFDILVDDNGERPIWTQRAAISERLIPYANKANVQSGGRGNWRITVTARVTTAANLTILQNSVGATGRTLSDFFSNSYSDTLLVDVSRPRRMNDNSDWRAELTFVREGT